MLATSAWPRTLPLVRPFTCGTASQPSHRLLRPRLTSRSGSTPLPFRAQGEISPGKNALLHCTAAGSTLLPLDHENFAVIGPLALVGNAFYPVLVHRPAASLHASSPQSVARMQLRFASLVVINSRWDLHPQECAHAGRTNKKGPAAMPGLLRQTLYVQPSGKTLRSSDSSPPQSRHSRHMRFRRTRHDSNERPLPFGPCSSPKPAPAGPLPRPGQSAK